MTSTERFTVRLGEARRQTIEQLVDDGVYPHRSAALRAAVDALDDQHPQPSVDDAGRPVLADGGSNDE